MGLRRLAFSFGCVAVGAGLGLVACAPEVQPVPVAPAATYVPKKHAPGPMEGVRPIGMAGALAAAGLDVRNLAPLEQLTPAQKQKVMRTFTESLGVPCLV